MESEGPRYKLRNQMEECETNEIVFKHQPKCNLCLWEFFFISCEPQILTHNHRNELTSTCIHSKKFLLITVIANRMLYTRSLHFYHPITSRHVTLKGIVPILKCEYLRL